MKKNINEQLPNLEEKEVKSSHIKQYFTEAVAQRVNEMTLKQMENLMKEFASTDYWIAFIKYNEARLPALDSILRGTNPDNGTHMISWAQGCMAGLCDAENYVISLNSPKQEE